MSLTKATYSMIQAAPVNAFDFMSEAQRASVASGDLVEDVTVPLQAAITAAAGKQLWLPKGNYKITGTLNLPQQIRLTGEVLRGGNGTTITAQFAGPAISRTANSITPCEIYLEHLFVFGKYTTYGVGNGIFVKNSPSFSIQFCVVAGFGNNQIHIDEGSWACLVRDVYVAETWGDGASNANIYCKSEFGTFDRVESDNGKYSIYLDTGAYGSQIMHCTLEGWYTAGIQINNSATLDRSIVQGNKLNNTHGGYAMSIDSNRCNIIGNQIITNPLLVSTQGIYVSNLGYGSNIIGNHVLAGQNGTAIWIESSGYLTVVGNEASGAYGIDIDSTTYQSIVEGNLLNGTTTPAILRSSGNRLKFANNNTSNGSGVIMQPTVVGGTPTADFAIEFTPSLTINGSTTGITYATNGQAGYYTKNGDRVFFNLKIELTSKGGLSGTVRIENLPFTNWNNAKNISAVAIYGTNLDAGVASLQAQVNPNTSYVVPYKFASGAATQLTAADLTNTSILQISGSYLALT